MFNYSSSKSESTKATKRLATTLSCFGLNIVPLSLPMIWRKIAHSGYIPAKEIVKGNVAIESYGRFDYKPLLSAEVFSQPLLGHGGDVISYGDLSFMEATHRNVHQVLLAKWLSLNICQECEVFFGGN